MRLTRSWILVASLASAALASTALGECTKDTDCKGDRICVEGECQNSAKVNSNDDREPGKRKTRGASICACCCLDSGPRTCLSQGPGVTPGPDGAPCHIGMATGTICCDE